MKLIIIIILLFCVGCSTSYRVKTGSSAGLSQLSKYQSSSLTDKTSSENYIKIETDNSSLYFLPNISGDEEVIFEMDQITVFSKSKTLPERDGKVTIDFNITVPEDLLSKSRAIVITPVLHLGDYKRCLSEITIRGELFDKVQQRNYWQYSRFQRTYRPGEQADRWAYNRFIRNPLPENVRLDSVITKTNHLIFYYKQEVLADQTSKTMLITLESMVKGLDGSRAEIISQDTLRFNISSILWFVDKTPRYKKRIIERKHQITERRRITFGVDECRIDNKLGNNHQELSEIIKVLKDILNGDEYELEDITITAGSSPEGAWQRNGELSFLRANAVKEYISKCLGKGTDIPFAVKGIGEDWSRLEEMIKEDCNRLDKKDGILNIIKAIPEPDKRELIIRKRYPDDNVKLRKDFYPELRAVDFTYTLLSKKFQKDTVITKEPDESYNQAIVLLEQRNYAEALYILNEYTDINTAIYYLSMGYNRSAIYVLNNNSDSAHNAYLKAIAFSRAGQIELGRHWYLESLRLDPDMEYRARLDPEIYELQTNKNEKIEKMAICDININLLCYHVTLHHLQPK